MVIAVLITTFAPRGGVRVVEPSGTPAATPVGAPGAGDGPARGPATVLLVHVLGAVAVPGLVELHPGSRVVDAIAAAGGLTADANAAGVNLARPVSDGEQLTVPREGEAIVPQERSGGASEGGGSAGTTDSLVSLNRASVAELQTLPRIGPALAQRIIDWREANGPFVVAADLMKVGGIGQKLFDGLKDLVTL
jgi:competence protein ComEA